MLAAPATRGFAGAEPVYAADFSVMRNEWNELLRNSDSDCLFLTWEWIATWWKHLGNGRDLAITAVRNDGRLEALAPFAVKQWPFPLMEFLGSGFAGSDYLDVIIRRSADDSVIDAIADSVGKRRQACRWNNVLDHATVAGVAARLGASGWACGRTTINLAPYIPLTGKTWEAYLAELGSEHRYNYNRKLRRLERDFGMSFERADAGAIDLVVDLHNQRRRTLGGSDAFHTSALVEFHREFVSVAADRGWLRMYVLKLNGNAVACLYGFFYDRKFYFYQSGFDPAYERYSPGLVMMGLTIQAAMEDGACEFDFLHGDEAYKRHWAGEQRELHRFELFPPTITGKLVHGAVDFVRDYRRVARGMQRKPR